MTVKYVVPFPPGGLTDVMARSVGQKLAEALKVPVVVENKAGGNAQIGADLVAKSAAATAASLLAITLAHAANATLVPGRAVPACSARPAAAWRCWRAPRCWWWCRPTAPITDLQAT
ncbi:MAG: hypothetical protein V9G09_09965 [Candidatus Nanopelagicales bacterium]